MLGFQDPDQSLELISLVCSEYPTQSGSAKHAILRAVYDANPPHWMLAVAALSLDAHKYPSCLSNPADTWLVPIAVRFTMGSLSPGCTGMSAVGLSKSAQPSVLHLNFKLMSQPDPGLSTRSTVTTLRSAPETVMAKRSCARLRMAQLLRSTTAGQPMFAAPVWTVLRPSAELPMTTTPARLSDRKSALTGTIVPLLRHLIVNVLPVLMTRFLPYFSKNSAALSCSARSFSSQRPSKTGRRSMCVPGTPLTSDTIPVAEARSFQAGLFKSR